MKKVHVNIRQFLDAESKPEDVTFFGSRNKLFDYTVKHNAFFPRKKIEQGSPLRSLLKDFF
ncbi:hypothetical protein IMZ48_22130 [Candidatus Bathyarchaeota archaeon]|nr:hypothetical protein [Candidatus Bathyarchaeota archaeon]